ncbi:MAG: membrane dipeptidase [Phycisphaeraceae bacterium]|nr:membrane dipeptidase [Phycisphaeraceae bacterium]
MPNHWFDAHLDLACLAVNKRDMTCADLAKVTGPWLPAAVTLPSLRAGGVVACLGTIFTEMNGNDAEGYPEGDVEAASRRGRAQLEVYRTWVDQGHIALGLRQALRIDAGVGAVRGGMGAAEVIAESPAPKMAQSGKLHVGILVECADPIRSPEELSWWVDAGVVAIGLSWSHGSRYSGGNGTPGVGINAQGREFIAAMDELRVIHDLSHLSQQSTEDLLELTDRPVMASHSNVRAFVNSYPERHLADETIAEIGRRGGMVGVNLVSNFIDPKVTHDPPTRARLSKLFDHIDRIAELMGRRDGVGLGSDMDGGFGSDWLPQGIDAPRDLGIIADGLRDRGWSEEDIEGFRFGNWARFIAANAPG